MRNLICDRCRAEYERTDTPEFFIGEYVEGKTTAGRVKDLCPNCSANLGFWFKSYRRIKPCK